MAPKETDYIELAHQRATEKKTHVSFPQLKYPSLRDGGFKDPVQWLMGKAMDDGAEGLWRVHDGIYDLNDFIQRHPGGAEWLELSKGTDITEAFESHHLNPTVRKMLDKFYVREAKTPRNSPFTFKEDGFYSSLRAAVYEELKKVPAHVPRRADMIINGLFTTLLVASAFSCYTSNYWASMASYLVASLSLAWVVVASHNYIHRKTNWRMYLFSLSLWSYRDFRVSHVLSHHLYPNTLMDLEVSAFEPIVFWNPRKQPFLSHFAILIEQIVFPFVFGMNFVKRFLLNFLRKGFFTNHYRWHDGVAFLLPVWMWIVSGNSFYNVVFMSETLDWGMHELEAVMDRQDINQSLFTVMTFFGDHALHHLFPTIDHAVLPYLYPVFLEHCQKFRANFRLTTQLDLIIGQIKMTLKTDPTLLKDDE
ncbi:Desaturase [Operophtera brumata]|uniref:Cytochrome b5-related protein n=1 Tax=Operophtera brumata TaxID=104452 RepID=A0A0L7L761_OPEBR|nr:Desaturase [Operophtera brumata]